VDNEIFKNKYRIPSARMANWDYGSQGLYYVTICTMDRVPYFGEIISQKDVTGPEAVSKVKCIRN
jgi:putative transposase